MSPGKFALAWAASCTALWGALLGIGAHVHGSRGVLPAGEVTADPDASSAAAAALARAEPFPGDSTDGAAPVGAAELGDGGLAPGQPAREPTWRIAALAHDPEVVITSGTIGKRTFLAALSASGLSTKDGFRLLKAFTGVRKFERCGQRDSFTFARDRGSRRLLAFEYTTSPLDVWQARAGDDGELVAKKLDFDLTTKRDDVAFVVTDDLRSSVQKAGLDDDLLATLDDALEGHAELSDIHPGARLRVIATESRVEGAFAGFASVDAVEYFPAAAGAQPVRVYRFPAGDDPAADHAPAVDRKKEVHVGYYDAPRGGSRTAEAGARRCRSPRISSRFNPRRMHPVLHIIKPHNGVDFAAPSGTPVYAAASGTVKVAGNGGACGNMVQILHVNGLVTAYCHLSRFADIHAGDHVEARQLIGYVGQTGRATGPHLHFALKRGTTFLDPLGLKLDGVRVVPPSERDAFDQERARLDAELDGIALPSAPPNLPPASSLDGGVDEANDPSSPADEADMLEEGN